ncbi:hypothetical protein [Brevundimonas sp.]|uniref:hypothetical protein n=1 Tax=Brevundimonas sp. TaxID=1871086 RepID=UPI0035AE0F67
MIPILLALLTLVPASQQASDLTTVVRTTLERCVSAPDEVVSDGFDVADADRARPFRNEHACGLAAEGWTGDQGAMVAAARAAVGANGPDWTGSVRELRVTERGPALWTQLEQVEGWAPASLLIIEPPPSERGSVEVHFDPAGL